MKKIVLLFIFFCFVRGVYAWNEAGLPSPSFRSTSSMMSSGSSLPLSAINGAHLAGSRPQYIGSYGPNRSPMDEDPFGGETIDDIDNPEEPGNDMPIGDALPPLLLIVLAYTACRLLKKHIQPTIP